MPLDILDAAGRAFTIPSETAEDFSYFHWWEGNSLRRYYDENGYVVVRGVIPQERCQSVNDWFFEEVKPYKGHIYRQTTANPERHVFTEHGFMLNPILNVQSLDGHRFPYFRAVALEVLTHTRMQSVVRELLGEPGRLVQSMYFEGNPKTWAHQDTYYLDSEDIGRMTAAWIALEDIAPGAGRFFIYPKSHLIDMERNGGNFDVAFHHDRYKKLVVDVIQKFGLECRAPALRRGDVLFWSSKTMHGSLETTDSLRSRQSLTAHYIPRSKRFLQFQSRLRGLSITVRNGMDVHAPKDLNRPTRRAMFWLEKTFPAPFQVAKRLAIKTFTG